MRPDADLHEVRRSHERLLATVRSLDDETARRSSLLLGWNVAMAVTHLARHADSQAGVLRGETTARYPSIEARDAGIEAGRGASAGALLDDLGGAVERLEAAWDGADWSGAGERLPGVDRELFVDYPFQRWREVEVHHTDLGLGHGPADWPVALAERWLPELVSSLVGRAEPRALMAWALGRGGAPDLEPWR